MNTRTYEVRWKFGWKSGFSTTSGATRWIRTFVKVRPVAKNFEFEIIEIVAKPVGSWKGSDFYDPKNDHALI